MKLNLSVFFLYCSVILIRGNPLLERLRRNAYGSATSDVDGNASPGENSVTGDVEADAAVGTLDGPEPEGVQAEVAQTNGLQYDSYGEVCEGRICGGTTNSDECVDSVWVCDGLFDCGDDQADEQFCACPENYGPNDLCDAPNLDDNEGCMAKVWRCNGFPNCLNGADERNCTDTIQHGEEEFQCLDEDDGEAISIPAAWRCDGDSDCPSGNDETNCGHILEQENSAPSASDSEDGN